MSKFEKIGLVILLLIIGYVFAMAKHRNDLAIELNELQIQETKLSIEKLNFELSIYREQEALVATEN